MERSEMERFRFLLERMFRDAEHPPVKREEIAVENAADAIDQSQRVADRELAIHQIESNFNRAQAIRLALDRIKDGSYGICLRCDEEISPKRLRAVPWAAYCIRCQEAADREQREPDSEHLHALLHTRDVA